jgi:hypothetical protein
MRPSRLPRKSKKRPTNRRAWSGKGRSNWRTKRLRHVSIPLTDATAAGGCVTLGSMNLNRDTDSIALSYLQSYDQTSLSVKGTARNGCAGEAYIWIRASFFDRFGTEVGTASRNALVPPSGSIPFRIVPGVCTVGQTASSELCATAIDKVRVLVYAR